IEVLEMPFTQALEAVASGEIRDAKAVILLQYLQASGLMS
ncbi:MAG TPA: GDP-mannose pyrophosphatase NudK, partial [Leclercia adecarboxylata]|nr:GDP-mannose pyrophosphatase NudK [Leclercia adecarboxylata]